MFRKLLNVTATFVTFALVVPSFAAAHVAVLPKQIPIGSVQVFTVSVPNEKDTAVTGLKLVLPVGLLEVSPTVKAGWGVQIEPVTRSKSAALSAIVWSSGSIPAGQRDDFTFSAQAPAQAAELQWKAYQTYADGTTVSWDQKPSGSDDASGAAGPYSVTAVVNDLNPPASSSAASKNDTNNLSLAVAFLALILSLTAILRPMRKAPR